jgi:hypothetical protein
MIVHIDRAKENSVKFCEAFAAGAGLETSREYTGGPWAGFGSPRLWPVVKNVIKSGEDFYYGDHGYFGRGDFFRVTKNAFQHNGIGPGDIDRARRFFKLAKRWNKDGRDIVICAQTSAYYDRFGDKDWLDRTMKMIRMYSDRKIIVRQKFTKKPLAQDFMNAWCVVCHTSNCAVDAIMAGIPAFTTGQCAASPMTLSDLSLIEYPLYPDGRMNWAGVLAANQWTLDEIKAGHCWKKLNGI